MMFIDEGPRVISEPFRNTFQPRRTRKVRIIECATSKSVYRAVDNASIDRTAISTLRFLRHGWRIAIARESSRHLFDAFSGSSSSIRDASEIYEREKRFRSADALRRAAR